MLNKNSCATIVSHFQANKKYYGFSRKAFHNHLKIVRERARTNTILDKSSGICRNVTLVIGEFGGDYYAAVAYYARNWPKHSGRVSFPVPHYDVSISDHLWIGEYGKRRLELLDYLIRVTR